MEEADAVSISAATIWEIEIKRALDKAARPEERRPGSSRSPASSALRSTFEHAREAGQATAAPRDPFDRMLVAQARVEKMTLASADAVIRRYDVSVFEVVRN